jgi:hypothetical protein
LGLALRRRDPSALRGVRRGVLEGALWAALVAAVVAAIVSVEQLPPVVQLVLAALAAGLVLYGAARRNRSDGLLDVWQAVMRKR